MNWIVIRALMTVGLARDVQLLPRNAEQFRIGRVDAVSVLEPEAEPAT